MISAISFSYWWFDITYINQPFHCCFTNTDIDKAPLGFVRLTLWRAQIAQISFKDMNCLAIGPNSTWVESRKRPWSEVTPNWELTKKIGKTNRYWYKERQWAMWLKFGMDKHKQRKINAYYSGNFREHDEINIVIIGHQWCARSDRRLESYSWPSAPWRPAGLRPHSRASSKKQVLLGNILPNSGHLYVYCVLFSCCGCKSNNYYNKKTCICM